MSQDQLRPLLQRNSEPDKQSISTAEGLTVARQVAKAAREKGIVCALAGGLAMHLYGFTRATTGVDLIANASLAWAVLKPLRFGGETYQAATGGREIQVDWILRNDFFRDFYEAALRDAIETEEGLFVVSPAWLVILKYIAGRGKDQIDLQWLLQQPDLVNRDDVRRLMNEVLGEKPPPCPYANLSAFSCKLISPKNSFKKCRSPHEVKALVV